MKKALLIVSTDPQISKIADEMGVDADHLKQRAAFVMKQLDDERAKMHEKNKKRWDEITARMKEFGIMPAYDGEKQNLYLDREADCIFIEDKENDHPMSLAKFFSIFGSNDE